MFINYSFWIIYYFKLSTAKYIQNIQERYQAIWNFRQKKCLPFFTSRFFNPKIGKWPLRGEFLSRVLKYRNRNIIHVSFLCHAYWPPQNCLQKLDLRKTWVKMSKCNKSFKMPKKMGSKTVDRARSGVWNCFLKLNFCIFGGQLY